MYSYSVPLTGAFDGTGNIKSYTDSVMGTWNFGYDNLNRLSSAVPGTGAPGDYTGQNLCMYYDSFGNRTQSGFQTAACPAPAATAPSPTANYNAANRVTWTTVNAASGGFTYDAAGNVLYDGANYYAYDGEGRLCATQNNPISSSNVAAYGYLYDAEGRRVAKGTIPVILNPQTAGISCNTSAITLTQSYILGQSGEQLTTLDQNGSGIRTNVFAGGMQLATYDASGLHFQLTDPLGTRRVQVSANGEPELNCQSLPFGDQQYCFLTSKAPESADDATPLHFTGKERDTESGLDYFGARYYGSSMGRWMSPDWSAKAEPVPYSKLDNPQTLNLYSYVQNNPLSNLDDDGHATIELRYTPVAVGNHTYIVVTDTNGHQTYYRAGPTNGASSGWISPASSGSSTQGAGSNSSNSSNSTTPGAGPGGAGANTGPFGALTAEHGNYVPGTVDYETKPAASVTLLSNDQPAASYTDQLNQYEGNINGANIPYNPLSTNSNAYAEGAAKFLGLNPPASPPVLAPGHGTPLPVPPPSPPTPPPTPPCSVAGACH